jgi:hypothetical protein
MKAFELQAEETLIQVLKTHPAIGYQTEGKVLSI